MSPDTLWPICDYLKITGNLAQTILRNVVSQCTLRTIYLVDSMFLSQMRNPASANDSCNGDNLHDSYVYSSPRGIGVFHMARHGYINF